MLPNNRITYHLGLQPQNYPSLPHHSLGARYHSRIVADNNYQTSQQFAAICTNLQTSSIPPAALIDCSPHFVEMKTHFSLFLPLTLMATLAIAGLDDILSQLPECAHGCVKDALERYCPPEDQTQECLCRSHDGGLEFLLLCDERMKNQTCHDAAELCGFYTDPYPYIPSNTNGTNFTTDPNVTVVACGGEEGAYEPFKVSQDAIAISVSAGFIFIVAGCIVTVMIRRRRSQKVPESAILPDKAPPPPYTQNPPPQQPPPQLGDPPVYEQPSSTAGPATA